MKNWVSPNYEYDAMTNKVNPSSSEKGSYNKLQSYLSNPQSLNSYSYAINNPLKYVDADGKYYQYVAGAAVGFLGGVVGQYGHDIVQNINNGNQNIFVPQSSVQEYLKSGGEGSLVGLSTAACGVGCGSATVSSLSVVDNLAKGEKINVGRAVTSGLVTLVTGTLTNQFPKVVGREPSLFTKSFFTGAHTQYELIKEGVNTMTQFSVSAVSTMSNLNKQQSN
jgi:hypothetical protein